MIQCSPQELIAESMLNCFQSSLGTKRLLSAKSVEKPLLTLRSKNACDKISLKKSVSQNKFPIHCQAQKGNMLAFKPQFSKNLDFHPAIPRVVLHTFPFENKFNQNALPTKSPPKFRYFSPSSHQAVFHKQTKQIQRELNTDEMRLKKDKLSQVQTYNSLASLMQKKFSNQPSTNTDSRQKIKTGNRKKSSNFYAEKNCKDQKKSLDQLNPKFAESQVNDAPRLSDQYSEVLQSYFPLKTNERELLIKSRTNFI